MPSSFRNTSRWRSGIRLARYSSASPIHAKSSISVRPGSPWRGLVHSGVCAGMRAMEVVDEIVEAAIVQ